MMRFYIEGTGLLGPGLDGWAASRAVLAGEAEYLHAATLLRASDMLPAAERRRAGVPIKLALAVGQEVFAQAGRDTQTTSTVFTSSGGDNDNVHAINGILATAPREVSPTRFHNSVHNAAAGYWCIAAGSHEPSTSLCAHDASFAAGLLEAAVQVTAEQAVVALIAYDHCYPEPLHSVRPIAGAFGMALLFAPQQNSHTMAAIEIDFAPGKMAETPMQNAGLEAVRCGIPAARSLPLLSALARSQPAHLTINYFNNHLNIRLLPC